jgi:Predicted membrane protein
MIHNFLKAPQANSLAIAVLIALIITWFTSLVLSLRDAPVRADKGWYTSLLPAFSLLGIPATLDLLQIKGVAFLFAAIVFLVFGLNVLMPVLRMTGKSSNPLVMGWQKWAIPIAIIGGLAVAGYLTFIEATATPVMCGPTGGCAEVQNSKYAILFGILPIGVLGLIGYLAILAGWIVWQFGAQATQKLGALSIWGMCIFGVLFSIYLTFLEPFVIGATCMWCISSAVLMIILLLVSTPAAQQALTIPDD